MARVWIPSLLRDLTGGQDQVDVAATKVREIVAELERRFPGVQARLCAGDSLRPGIAVIVDSQATQLGLMQSVGPNSEVHFLPALSGG
jgi:molybdopterin synthase sulfur carrier subunit